MRLRLVAILKQNDDKKFLGIALIALTICKGWQFYNMASYLLQSGNWYTTKYKQVILGIIQKDS